MAVSIYEMSPEVREVFLVYEKAYKINAPLDSELEELRHLTADIQLTKEEKEKSQIVFDNWHNLTRFIEIK